jgi:MOSC domain-containing protein YiiM
MTAERPGRSGQACDPAPGGVGTIVSINISRKKGQAKSPVSEALVIAHQGILDDAHLGFAHRQVSLLMMESIEEQRARLKGDAGLAIGPGAFAENFTTRGIDLTDLVVGDELVVRGKDDTVRLRVSQLGKECHTKCAIYKLTGDCIMPELGVFCEVLEGGKVRIGDRIEKR